MEEVEEKYKSLSLYLKCLHSALTGGYANFGVFQLYNGIYLGFSIFHGVVELIT
jgi:hypothetical protein